LGLALGDPSPARAAADVRLDQSVHIGPDEVLERGLFNTGESLIIEGKVVGDVVAFCERVTIRGIVEGDVWVIAREFELTGEVKGNLHAFGERSRISGRVDGSLYNGSDQVNLEPEARVERDAFVLSGRFIHDGVIGRDLTALVSRGELQGAVGRHAEIWSEQLEARAGTTVGGDLTAHVDDEEDAVIDPAVEVAGASQILSDELALHRIRSNYQQPAFYLWRLVWMAAAFGVGLLLLRLVPSLFDADVASAPEFFRALGLGFAFAVLVPIGLVVLLLSVIGVPLALIGASLYAMVWYLAVILVAVLVGRSLTSMESDSLRDQGLALLLGLVLVTIAFHLPWIGGLVRFVGMLLGAGLLLDRALALWNARRTPAY
ncbi:MAG: polymer-forming cytoskeletal protein, partial [Deltaproteobacteria bacterium]|nr:polymer-forming cytoskeletal protein [Deltaproteobacteria bacterium]